MARNNLGFVLVLLTTAGCAGQPWLSRGGAQPDVPAALRPSDRFAQPAAAPGFWPNGYAREGGPQQAGVAVDQQPPYQMLPGGESPRQQNPQQANYRQPIPSPPAATFGSTNPTQYTPVYQAAPSLMPYQAAAGMNSSFAQASPANGPPPASRQPAPAPYNPPATGLAATDPVVEPEVKRDATFNINDLAETAAAKMATTDSPPPASTGETPAASEVQQAVAKGASDQRVKQAAHAVPVLETVQPGLWREEMMAAVTALDRELMTGTFTPQQRSRLQANSRLLHAIMNDRDRAVAPIKGIEDDEREYWKHVAHGLMTTLDADEKHTASKRAALALRSIRRAADHLANISTLDLRNLAFCSKVESYGRFSEFKSSGFKPSQEVLLYVEVENFAVDSTNGEHETELQGEYSIFDVDGKRVANAVLALDKQVSKNRRHDYFIAYRIFMPKKIEPGHYTLELTIEDLKGSKSNQASVEFWIR